MPEIHQGGVRDRPANLGLADPFSHDDYAQAAAETLIDADRTFTLGLFGDWGLGKTTIIRRLGKLVRDRGLAFVEFDVWRFEGDALRRQFLRETATQLKKGGHLSRRYNPSKELRDLEIDVPVVQESLRLSVLGVIRALLIGCVVGLALYLFLRSRAPTALFGHATKKSTANEIAFILGATTFLYNVLSQMLLVEQRVMTVRRVEEPERFYAKFQALLQKTKAERVVIAIDNLDRCSPPLVDTMLATIKTYLEPAQESADARKPRRLWRNRDAAGAVFVIAADDAAVRRHMVGREIRSLPTPTEGQAQQALLAEAEGRVDEYLRKFFDASIRLRPILQEDIRKYTRAELARVVAYARQTAPPTSMPRWHSQSK